MSSKMRLRPKRYELGNYFTCSPGVGHWVSPPDLRRIQAYVSFDFSYRYRISVAGSVVCHRQMNCCAAIVTLSVVFLNQRCFRVRPMLTSGIRYSPNSKDIEFEACVFLTMPSNYVLYHKLNEGFSCLFDEVSCLI